jgi:PadR family transcriptional regulator PadR
MSKNTLKQMRRGLLELAILTIIDSARPPMRLDEIMQKLSKTVLRSPEGTIYSIFSRFRKQNMIMSEYDEQDAGTGRRCYYLTNQGRVLLYEMRSYWRVLDHTLKDLDSPR